MIDDSLECLNETGMLRIPYEYMHSDVPYILRIKSHYITYREMDGIYKEEGDEYEYVLLSDTENSTVFGFSNDVLMYHKSNPLIGDYVIDEYYYTYTELEYISAMDIEKETYENNKFIVDFGAIEKGVKAVSYDYNNDNAFIFTLYVGITSNTFDDDLNETRSFREDIFSSINKYNYIICKYVDMNFLYQLSKHDYAANADYIASLRYDLKMWCVFKVFDGKATFVAYAIKDIPEKTEVDVNSYIHLEYITIDVGGYEV